MLTVVRTFADKHLPLAIHAENAQDDMRVRLISSHLHEKTYDLLDEHGTTIATIERHQRHKTARLIVHLPEIEPIEVKKDIVEHRALYQVRGAGLSTKGAWSKGKDFFVNQNGNTCALCLFVGNEISMSLEDFVTPAQRNIVVATVVAMMLLRFWDLGDKHI